MHSCIYKGQVNHRRYSPKSHEFSYTLFMMYVDLDELPTLFSKATAWRIEKPALASFYRKDHYGDNKLDLAESIKQLVFDRTQQTIEGPIRLLTHFRYFGHIFNPLSVYYCFDKTDTYVTHVVSEVTNTPWKEQYCYVLPGKTEENQFITAPQAKDFHVSPYMDMNMDYRWNIDIPGEHLKLNIENYAGSDRLFDASMSLKRIEINNRNLNRTLIAFPLMTLKVISAIHFQALKLWLKGIEYIPHPKNN